MDQNLTPKISHAEFPNHKHVQKALNDKTRILEVGEGRWGMGIKFVLVFPIYIYIACEEIMTSTYMSLNEYFSIIYK